ncbi:hypothetical protein EVAR_91966_1 [Eumeta japonica]|uniref:Uncharacterized protein n=1 Tax=Eumeta variegata TaxID=151549 RepID=A0A4C1SDA1_EUMVA|nr:hypothetical protein EVAR_91966_1 [Eumeta japonica]
MWMYLLKPACSACWEAIKAALQMIDSEQWFGETGRNLIGKVKHPMEIIPKARSGSWIRTRHGIPHALMDNMFHLRNHTQKTIDVYTQVLEFSLSFTSCLRSLNCGVMDRSRPDSRVTIFPN